MVVRRGQRKTYAFHESVLPPCVAKPFHRFAVLSQAQLSTDIVLRGVNLLALRVDERVVLVFFFFFLAEIAKQDEYIHTNNKINLYVKLKF